MVRQAKGKKHCKYIKKKALQMWRATNYQDGMWIECLKTCIEKHRQSVADEIMNERRAVAQESRRAQRELAFCDNNGWIG